MRKIKEIFRLKYDCSISEREIARSCSVSRSAIAEYVRRATGSHLKAMSRLNRVQLLIIDDFLLTPLSDIERRDMLEIIEDRYQTGAAVITSQCPVGDWHPKIGEPTLADALCDRLLHNAYKIELRGESMRLRSTTGNRKNERKEVIVSGNKTG